MYIDNLLNKIRQMDHVLGSTQVLVANNAEIVERNRLQMLQSVIVDYFSTDFSSLLDESKIRVDWITSQLSQVGLSSRFIDGFFLEQE